MEDVDVDSPKMDHANRIKSSCQATKSNSNWITYIFLPFNKKRSNYYSHENTTSKTTLKGGLESKLILIFRAMDRARFVGVSSSRHQTTELRPNVGSMPVQRLRRLAWHIEPALDCGLVFWRNVHQVRVRDQLRSLGADMWRRVRREGVPLDMKGCICHFTKWQIHPFIYKGTIGRYTLSYPRGRLGNASTAVLRFCHNLFVYIYFYSCPLVCLMWKKEKVWMNGESMNLRLNG